MISSDSDNEILNKKNKTVLSKRQSDVKTYSSDDSSEIVKVQKYEKNMRNQLSSAEDSSEDVTNNQIKKNHVLECNESVDSDLNRPTEKEVFGSDTDDDDKPNEPVKVKPLIAASDDSDFENNVTYTRGAYAPVVIEELPIAEEAEEAAAVAATAVVVDDGAIEVDFPVIKADLGDEMHLVKLPNFLSVETRPFDAMYYEDELDEDEVQDEDGKTRLKLKVENTIRWRFARDSENQPVLDADEQPVRESNARMVRWSDGSLSLHLGREIFDVHTMDISGDHNHLFVREGSGLQAQAVFGSKLAFRPHSTDSFTHRKLTLSMADKSHKATAKVKLLPFAGENPDLKQQELIKREDEKMRANLRRENQRRKIRDKASHKQMTASFLEQHAKDDEHNPHAISLSDIKKKAISSQKRQQQSVSIGSGSNAKKKNKAKINRKKFHQLSSTDDDDDEEEEDYMSELSDPAPSKAVSKTTAKRARIVSDEDNDSD